MKKLISIIMVVTLIFSVNMISYAENDEVIGLEEHLNALFFKNYFTQEQCDELIADWEQGQREWYATLETQAKSYLLKSYNGDIEIYLEKNRPCFNKGLLVTELLSTKYLNQYAQNGKFSYLFSDSEFWDVGSLAYDKEGLPKSSSHIFSSDDKMFDFLTDKDTINNLLLEKKEIMVSDIKLFNIDISFSFLYIKCNEKEYIIKLWTGSGGGVKIPQIEMFKLYSIEEVMSAVAEWGNSTNVYKPTFSTEAEALQSAGLLNGNEKGLDLLKPLTRIEAATMLLRAIGESETVQPGSPQVFSDVPPTHWGFGAAEKAQSLGIVNGMGDGTFAPDAIVTDNQFATMVLRAADTGEFDWQQGIQILIDRGIITAEDAETMDLFTRGDMAKIIYEAREKGLL